MDWPVLLSKRDSKRKKRMNIHTIQQPVIMCHVCEITSINALTPDRASLIEYNNELLISANYAPKEILTEPVKHFYQWRLSPALSLFPSIL